MKIIAHIHNAFTSKFGIPRQSGLSADMESHVVFTPEYRVGDALRGLDGFSHIWLIWEFSETKSSEWSPTVRPPRLGGNTRVGVFATRSPYRPNPLGLSCVRLLRIESDPCLGDVLIVSGADLMDGTPIYDIKPYIPFSDSIADAVGGFASENYGARLKVSIPPELEQKIPSELLSALYAVLEQDPRPAYQNDPARVYGFSFGGMDIHFSVRDDELTVTEILAPAVK